MPTDTSVDYICVSRQPDRQPDRRTDGGFFVYVFCVWVGHGSCVSSSLMGWTANMQREQLSRKGEGGGRREGSAVAILPYIQGSVFRVCG
mmetsp:Transcript_484/g.1050  ORF Transcript_484/g.1050 Transcript_484/m.1050 type:complete len:90 (-) Transcript_484:210-479(-)